MTVAVAVAGYWSVHVANSAVRALDESVREEHEAALAEERVREEVELEKESLRRSQHAIDGAGDGYWHWNLTTDDCEFSTGWAAMLGFEACGMELYAVLCLESRRGPQRRFQ